MVSNEKLVRALRSKSPFTEDEIAAMPDAQGWDWIYANAPPRKLEADPICLTGFSAAECADLEARIALAPWLRLVGSVTANLAYLVTGGHPGPAKLAKAQARGVPVLSKGDLLRLLDDGELPRREIEG